MPPPWPESDLRARVRAATIASGRKIVVLDDDPMGAQTVYGVSVLTRWSAEAHMAFYVLTNSRCHPLEAAAAINREVARNLAQVVRRLPTRPAYLIGKGGITCSDPATDALGVRQAQAPGQILPGVPVWRLGPESRYPGLPCVIFPGNVGGPDALARAIQALRGEGGA